MRSRRKLRFKGKEGGGYMKEIKAIIQPSALNQVLIALHEFEGLPGCTVSKVHGYGRVRKEGGADSLLEPADLVKLEIVVPNKLVKKVLEEIYKHAHTGNTGDGKVFVIETVDALSLKTGDQGEAAL
jgi:nitrogen regulatory protein PII